MPAATSVTRGAGISFRSALLVSVVAILLAAVGVLGIVSYVNARAIVDDLAYQALDQTAARVHDRLRDLLDGASHAGKTTARRLTRKHWSLAELPTLVQGFHDSIVMNHALSYISLGLEAGGYGHVYRTSSGELEGRVQIVEGHEQSRRRDYEFVDGVLRERVENRAVDDYDPRKRGWYQRAKENGTQTWPPVYLFINKPNPDYPGLTCATPVRDPSGAIQGVTTADFDLIALGRFLSELDVLKGGVAFVVEIGSDGTHRVVAHPDSETILGRFEVDGVPQEDILPVEEIPDASVRALTATLQRTPATSRLRITDVEVGETHFIGAYGRLDSEHDLNWVVALLVPRDALMAPVESSSRRSLWIGLVSLALAGLLAWLLARRIAKPLELLAQDTEAIARFELRARSGTASRFTELRRLSGAMEEMKSGLRSFRRYVPADLVRGVLESGEEVSLGGERRELTVCFTDIQDFTRISEQMSPEALVDWLGAYFEAVSAAFADSGGTVDKYIGDSVMAFWGAPRRVPNHAEQACLGALVARDALEDMAARLAADGQHPLHVRFGLGTGELLVGNIGSDSRLNYTVIGDAVNLASRLESLNKMYGTRILIDARTRELAGAAVVARPLEYVSVRGRTEGTLVHELLASAEQATAGDHALVEQCTRALALYRSRDFVGARVAYEEVLGGRPQDGVAFVMVQSCMQYERDPPGEEWDGIRRMTEA
jgi:adenylate cyclase